MGAHFFKGGDTVAKVPTTEDVKFPSGGSVLQTTVMLSSGKRIRLSEGTQSYINAQFLLPGDMVEFSFETIKDSSFKVNEGQQNERTLTTSDLVGVFNLECTELGSFSTTPTGALADANRTAVEVKERVIAAKTPPLAPPVPNALAQENLSQGSPFDQEQ